MISKHPFVSPMPYLDQEWLAYNWVYRDKLDIETLILVKKFAVDISEEHERKFWEPLSWKIIDEIIEWKMNSILMWRWYKSYDKDWKLRIYDFNDPSTNLYKYRKKLTDELSNKENLEKFPLPLTQITEKISEKVLKIFDLVEKSV